MGNQDYEKPKMTSSFLLASRHHYSGFKLDLVEGIYELILLKEDIL